MAGDRASAGLRLLAAVLDGGILFAVALALVGLIASPAGEEVFEIVGIAVSGEGAKGPQDITFAGGFVGGIAGAIVIAVIATAIALVLVVGLLLVEVVFGITPGKAVLGLRIARPDGESSSFRQRLARSMFKGVPFLIGPALGFVDGSMGATVSVLMVVAFLAGWALVLSNRRQTFYDEWSGAVVLKRSK